MKVYRDKDDPYYIHDYCPDGNGGVALWIIDNIGLYNRMRRNPSFDSDLWAQCPPASGKKTDRSLLPEMLSRWEVKLVEMTRCLYCNSVGFNVPEIAWLCPSCWREREREQGRKSTARYRARHRGKLPNECSHCSEPMTSQRKTRKYCSARCRVAANRAASL